MIDDTKPRELTRNEIELNALALFNPVSVISYRPAIEVICPWCGNKYVGLTCPRCVGVE